MGVGVKMRKIYRALANEELRRRAKRIVLTNFLWNQSIRSIPDGSGGFNTLSSSSTHFNCRRLQFAYSYPNEKGQLAPGRLLRIDDQGHLPPGSQ